MSNISLINCMAEVLCPCQGLEFTMYNERTRQPEAVFSGAMRPRRSQVGFPPHTRGDIPVFDLTESSSPRRGCDGTPRVEHGHVAHGDSCGGRCGKFGIEGHPLAMVYSPCQAWKDAYTPEVALARGTLFPELDLPFEPTGCKRGCM